MAEESFQEKTEQATPKRREESRQKGQVARSTELSTVAVLGAGLLSLWGLGSYMGTRLTVFMQNIFVNATTIQLDPITVVPHLLSWIEDFALTVAPVMGLLVLAALAVNLAQVGVLFSADSLMPKGERISPLKGLKRIFSKKGLVELAKGLFKIGIVGYVTYLTILSEAEDFVGFVDLGVDQVFGLSAGMILTLGLRITMLLLILAVLDFAFQRWDHEKNLRMTRQEVKEELKQQEGDPLLGARHVLVVHGHGGLDELSLSGENSVWELQGGEVRRWRLKLADTGLPACSVAEIGGGSKEENAGTMRRLFNGEKGPIRDTVLLNSAGVLLAGDKVENIAQGVEVATAVVDSGDALKKLDGLVELSRTLE